MAIRQREILEVNFHLPGNVFKPHPVIVLSNNDINEFEGTFVCVMLSSTPDEDEYSFFLDEEMLTKKTRIKTQVRCHLISLCSEREVQTRHGFMKADAFKKLIAKISESVFAIRD